MPRIALSNVPVCCRCGHVWLPDLVPGDRPAKLLQGRWVPGERITPKCCASCKSPYWDKRRKHKKHAAKRPPVPMAQRVAKARAMSGTEIFEQVMKTVKPKS
jgi:hypothetical protein